MSEAQQSLEEILFDLAVQKSSAAERNAFLDHACRGNPELRAALDDLLASHFGADGFLPAPAAGNPPPEALPTLVDIPLPVEAAALMVGRYKLLEKIGEGGFGDVWMAEQREPVKRRVALKVLKPGMDSRQVVARFEAERQALAMMDHPNIAKILDAGLAETGRPYFVMELVRGVKITEYCDQCLLPTAERLKLFIEVCKAVQHAHQKGIIHRDIKPSNILVTLHDGVPVPKVIDFGIAKATQQELTDKTVFTQFQQFIGTPAYISPEQAEMSGLDVDTRADIYSLGVLLYELLVGQTPFDAKEMAKGGLDALRKTLREKEPLRPSTKVNTLVGEERTTAGKRRQTEVGKLAHQLRGDLDWIVMKCLEKDRTRRYETANGLAADLRRHLDNEPVVARPPSTAYKILKAWQRNKLPFSAAAAVVLALVVSTTVSTWQAFVATRARSAAQKAEALAVAKEHEARAQQQRADREAAIARRTAYNASLASVQADWERRNYARVRETLATQQDYAEPSFEWFYWQRMTHLEQSSFPTYAGGIKTFSLSPDRTRAALVMRDDSIEIRSVPSGEKLVSFFGHGSLPLARDNDRDLTERAAFSPDGRWVASCGGQFFRGVIRLWDAQTGQEIRSFGESSGPGAPQGSGLPEPDVGNRQYALAFSPDGRTLASGGAHGKYGIQLWDVATGRKIRTLEVSTFDPWIVQLAFSGDGKHLFCRAERQFRPLLMYDVETGRLLDQMGNTERPPGVLGFAVSSDSRRLAVRRDRIMVYDLTARGFSKVLFEIPSPEGADDLSFSPDGRWLMSSGHGDSLIYDSLTGELRLTLRGGSSQSRFLADSQHVISTDGDRHIKIWNISSYRESARIATGYVPRAIAKDGSRLVVHLQPEETTDPQSSKKDVKTSGLGVVDLATARLISTMREHEPRLVDGVAFSPDNQWVVSGARDGTFRIWEAGTGTVKKTVEARSEHYSIGFGPRGDLIVSTLRQRDLPRPTQDHALWNIATGEKIVSVRASTKAWPWAMSPDGRRLATGGFDGTVSLWDTVTGNELRNWQAHERQQFEAMMIHANHCMDYSADGRHLVTGGYDGLVKLWDPETGRLERTLTGHSGRVLGVHFSPDQRRLVSRGMDGTVRFWDPATGKELLALTDPLAGGAWVWWVALSPDGRKVFSAHENRRAVTLWEAATPEQVAAWRRAAEADVALWSAEQPKMEARDRARPSGGAGI